MTARARVASRVLAIATIGLSFAGSNGCQKTPDPVGEVVLYVDTDAIVARAANDASPGTPAPAPLVDRVRFELFRGGVAVPNGTRDFLVDEDKFRQSAVSFGIVPEPGDGSVTVRVRLFRDDKAHEAAPAPGVSLDTTVRIPPVAAAGIQRWSVFLSSDDFGKRVGDPEPIVPAAGPPLASRVGSWPKAKPRTCADAPRDEEACVPGGTFFLGDPAMRGRTASNDVFSERLVVLSPFFLDRAEVTVDDFRRAWPDLAASGVAPPHPWTGSNEGAVREDYCTWTDPSASPDARPLNCVSWITARAYCERLGKDLPTEAQYEYLMSGMGRETAYLWGEDEPACSWAVWGRAGLGYYAYSAGDCRPPASTGGVTLAGSGLRDRVDLGGRAIVDLAGNVAEWARDVWSRESEPFWSPIVPMFDPVADVAGSIDGDRRAVRGGTWNGPPLGCRAAYRLQNRPTDTTPAIGFRCARAAQPREVAAP